MANRQIEMDAPIHQGPRLRHSLATDKGMAINAGPVAQRLFQCIANCPACIFGRVVGIDMQITVCVKGNIH